MRRMFLLPLAVAATFAVATPALAQDEDEEETAEESSDDDDDDASTDDDDDDDDDDASDDDDDEPKKKKKKKKKKKEELGDDDDDDDEASGGAKDLSWGHGGDVPSEPKPDAISGEHRWDVHLLDFMTFSVGFLGGAGAAFLDEPSDQSVQGQTGDAVDPDYPGFAGLVTSVGPTFEVRFLGYVGLELNVLVQEDEGKADLAVRQTVNGTSTRGEFTVVIRQSAVHVPLLLKGAIPGRIVTPVLFLGPEFVSVSSTEAVIEGNKPSFHTRDYRTKNPESYTTCTSSLKFVTGSRSVLRYAHTCGATLGRGTSRDAKRRARP